MCVHTCEVDRQLSIGLRISIRGYFEDLGKIVMDNQPAAERRTEKLDLRVSPSAKTKLQAAALVAQRSVSDFVMESALAKAEETLAERRVFGLDPEKWATLQTALDAPVRRLPRLRGSAGSAGTYR